MCYTTAILLLAITLGRAFGLLYVQESVRAYGLHMIETQNKDQLRGCLRVLCTFTDVLVTINGAWFFEGHRLDNRPDWAHFQRCYSLGHMDVAGNLCSNCGSGLGPVLPVANVSKTPTATTVTLPSPRPMTSALSGGLHLSRSSTQNSMSAAVATPTAPSAASLQRSSSRQQTTPGLQASRLPARPTANLSRRSTEPIQPQSSSGP